MNEQDKLINQVAENIAYYRKKMNLTQFELAEKLNYSDKSISKWERAEGIPTVVVLKEICDFFGITLNDITNPKKVKINYKMKKRGLIAYFYASIAFVVAVILYGIFNLIDINFAAWKLIIYAIPIASLVLFIFSIIWNQRIETYLYLSSFIWTLALSFYVSISIPNKYMIFIIAIPVHLFLLYLIRLIYFSKDSN
ncbi:MAG TPA: helix-turn-helix transcriptional regulator [Acholeplasma sp.]|nr:helix-turn-helix transcriptional regulator [Acholeplasma sp.]